MPTPPPTLQADDIAVVIPALDEALRIRDVVEGALRHCATVIVVDDGSTDGTAAAIADLPARVLRHPGRRGKGAALRTGFMDALQRSKRAVVTLDGDGQHDPDDIPRLLAAANLHPGRVVIGARLRHRDRQPRLRRLANAFADWGIAWGTGYRLVDSQSGMRLYPASACAAACAGMPGDDFVFEAQLLITSARTLGLGCVAVPIAARYNTQQAPSQYRRSHFHPLRDLWSITSHVVREVLRHSGMRATWTDIRRSQPLVVDPRGDHD